MEKAICAFEKQEEKRLGAKMEPKKVYIAEDETYHENPCLVAIEPASGADIIGGNIFIVTCILRTA